MNSNEIAVKFEKENNASRAYDGDKQIGECHFTFVEGRLIISRTDVDLGYEGQGIGKRLIQAVVDYARSEEIKIFPMCVYARKVMLSNSDYADVL